MGLDDLQNEKLYLNANKKSEIIKRILAEQRHTCRRKEDETLYFASAIDDYYKFIELIANYIKDLKIKDNSIVLSMLIRRLLFDGYFSVNNNFKADSNQSFYDVTCYCGLDIIDGKGCCRHLADFHQAIFDEMKKYNKMFACYYGNKDTILAEAFNQSANHAANLIMDSGLFYVYDSFRNIILRPTNKFTMTEIADYDKEHPIKFYYKPSSNVMACYMEYEEAMNLLKSFEVDSKKEYITYNRYLDFKKEMVDVLASNDKLFNELKSEGKVYTKKISDGMRCGFHDMVDEKV